MPEHRHSARVEKLLAPGRAVLAQFQREQQRKSDGMEHLDFVINCHSCDRHDATEVPAKLIWNLHGCSGAALCVPCDQAMRAELRRTLELFGPLGCQHCQQLFTDFGAFVSVEWL